jgi:hypothetical protein
MMRVVLLVLLVIGFSGCKGPSRGKQAAALLAKANTVWAKSGTNTEEWTAEWGRAFGPEGRARFPANRAELRTSADKIVKILDDETRLINEAVPQYEEAIALMTDERQQQGFALLVSSMKTSLEGFEFVKSQMQLVRDESIVDAKTFEEKFLTLGAQFGRSQRESKAQFEEGSRLLGIEPRR